MSKYSTTTLARVSVVNDYAGTQFENIKKIVIFYFFRYFFNFHISTIFFFLLQEGGGPVWRCDWLAPAAPPVWCWSCSASPGGRGPAGPPPTRSRTEPPGPHRHLRQVLNAIFLNRQRRRSQTVFAFCNVLGIEKDR